MDSTLAIERIIFFKQNTFLQYKEFGHQVTSNNKIEAPVFSPELFKILEKILEAIQTNQK